MTGQRHESRTEAVTERDRIPWDGIVFGYGAMLPFPAAALVVWLGGATLAAVAATLVLIWGAVILIFLAGVRRGLSFRTPGGPRFSQLAMMLWLFLAGVVALLLPTGGGLPLLLLGYLSLMVLDPIAARRDETPLYFARFRPWQMAVPVLSLALVLAAV